MFRTTNSGSHFFSVMSFLVICSALEKNNKVFLFLVPYSVECKNGNLNLIENFNHFLCTVTLLLFPLKRLNSIENETIESSPTKSVVNLSPIPWRWYREYFPQFSNLFVLNISGHCLWMELVPLVDLINFGTLGDLV